MKEDDKDLLVELVNNLQEELDVMWDSIADVEQALDKLDRAVNTEPDDKRHDDMWDRLLMLDQIISRNRPDWVGKWEEENCEGGANAQKIEVDLFWTNAAGWPRAREGLRDGFER